LTWNRQREKFLKDELKKHKFTTIQGYEWFIVDTPKKMELFRKIILDLTNQTLKPDEKIRKQPARGAETIFGPNTYRWFFPPSICFVLVLFSTSLFTSRSSENGVQNVFLVECYNSLGW
jgi:hypothetical protein